MTNGIKSTRYSKSQFDQMKEVILEKLSFKDLVATRTKIERIGNWYGVRCEFHSTNTTDAGRLKDNLEDGEATYYCNNSNCSAHRDQNNGRPLDMFGYWKLANDFNTVYDAILDLYENQLGLKLPAPEGEALTDNEIAEIKKEKRRALLKLHCVYFWAHCLHSPEGAEGLKYLNEERKIPMYLIEKFKLGYAVGNKTLVNYLLSQNFTIEELQEMQVVSKNGNDAYWGRIIIPLFETRNNPLDVNFDINRSNTRNFYSRLLPSFIKDEQSKNYKHRYLNREFPLFNFAEARKKKFAILPEGCVDTLSSQHFINELVELKANADEEVFKEFSIDPNDLGVFATYGTNGFSEKVHLPLVQKANFDVIFLAGDEDENFAGQMANIKRGRMFKKACPNLKVRIVKWPENDVNDMLVKDYSPLDFLTALENSVSLEEYEILVELQKCGSNELVRTQFEAINKISPLLGNLNLTDTKNLLLYKRTLEYISDYIKVDMETLLFHCLMYNYKETLIEESKANNISIETLLLSKIISLNISKE